MAWHLLAVVWLGTVGLAILLTAFRAIKTAGIAGSFQFDDVPPLRFFDTNFATVYWVFCGMAAVFGLVYAVWCWKGFRIRKPVSRGWFRSHTPIQKAAILTVVTYFLFAVLTAIACRPDAETSGIAKVEPISALDWIAVVSLAVTALLIPAVIRKMCRVEEQPRVESGAAPRSDWLTRNSGAYLLGSAAVFLYALWDHLRFWDPEKSNGYDYRQFFLPDEVEQANLVLYSTSILFASLAALGGCLLISVFRSAARKGACEAHSLTRHCDHGHSLTLLSAMTWSAMVMIPWQIKLWPEIEAERGWILPAVTLVYTAAALIPLLHVSRLLMVADFFTAEAETDTPHEGQQAASPFLPAPSELALTNHVAFPLYPWIRWIGIFGNRILFIGLLIVGAAGVGALTWLVTKIDDLYDFDDWRGMLKSGLLPFLRVSFALLCSGFVFVFLRRLVLLGSAVVSRWRWLQSGATVGLVIGKVAVVLLAVGTLGLATWPFWGWDGIRQNVFTRTAEYNSRHEFELRFLHWLIDCDRDGYSAVLHGGDPDDFDADILPLHLSPPRDDNPVPIDEFEVVDRKKAEEFPNLMILFLEGVTPKAISAYKQRRLTGTPNIDAVAREGTIFTTTRCFYPSTWDAWFSTVSGRFLRVKEFDMSRKFHDRYTRYNNLYKVLKLAGVNRWCHMDMPPYYPMLVPHDMRDDENTAWMAKFDSRVSADEEARGVWRGDKRNDRMLKFIDSIKPGEKFFVCEHMSDTHFPWREVPGLEWTSGDAVTSKNKRYETYDKYFQTVARMDRQIGALVKRLKKKGLYDNTMIVIVSDHGCQWWEHEHMYYVSHLYEQCLRVPMIVRIPRVQGRRAVHEPTLQIDLLPTILELAGVRHANPNRDHPTSGRSLLPLMTGKASAEERRRFAKRDVPLMTHFDKLGVLSQSRHKLIFNRTLGTFKLFDLKEDPGEMANLADSHPELLAELSAKLRQLIRRHPAMVGGIKKSGKSFD